MDGKIKSSTVLSYVRLKRHVCVKGLYFPSIRHAKEVNILRYGQKKLWFLPEIFQHLMITQ